MTHPGYFIDSHSGQPWFRCLTCQYDSFSHESIRWHVQCSCQPKALPETELPLQDWRNLQKGKLPGLRIGISLLTWNTEEASRYAAMSLVREKRLLADLGVDLQLFWADNGSTDDTKPALEAIFGSNLAAKSHFNNNLGQSKARNDLRGHILEADCDYWLMVDGDIEIVPYSSFAMARYLEASDREIGCIGMYCRNCTHVRDSAVADECRKIEPWMVRTDPPIAWTNYGMFRRSVFGRVFFDETGPFSGPGWGYEDDDFELSMAAAGFSTVNTPYFRHMHRKRHSSLRNLDAKSAESTYKARQAYVVSKWRHYSKYHDQRVSIVENQTMPVLY